jgi:epoxyqueuosine reductase
MSKHFLPNGNIVGLFGTNSQSKRGSPLDNTPSGGLSFLRMLSPLAVKERALQLGFDLAGVVSLAVSKDLEFARQWVERGWHGEMRYLENPKRFDPRLVLPSVQSAICVGLVYQDRIQDSGSRIQGGEGRSQESGVSSQNERRGQFSNSQFPVSALAGNGPQTTDNGQAPPPRAWISRYAWGRDYHEIMREKLEQLRTALEEMAPGVETRVFVDTGPVVERALARFSGLGWMGKNTCIINQEKGSWFFLGVILTNLVLEPDLPAADRCGSCTACLEACPTGALVEPYVMNASRCISYLTIELKGPIPPEFRAPMGANIFGCDICQDVCPWNSRRLSAISSQQAASPSDEPSGMGHFKKASVTKVPDFYPLTVALNSSASHDDGQRTTDHGPRTEQTAQFSLLNAPLEALASFTEDDFRRIFARSPVRRVKYRGWLRNLCVAMGNSGDGRFIGWLKRCAEHPDPMLREHAAWALDRLCFQLGIRII